MALYCVTVIREFSEWVEADSEEHAEEQVREMTWGDIPMITTVDVELEDQDG